MRRTLTAAALLAWVWSAPATLAQEEGRGLVRKAVEAIGGLEKLSQFTAAHSKIKGVLTELEGAAFTGEIFKQGPGRLRFSLRTELSGVTVSLVTVVNGTDMWMKLDGPAEPATEHTRKALQRSLHVDQVTGLVALLREERFIFTPLGEATKDGRAVLGLKVACKDQPDVALFFDKAAGYLLRAEYRGIDDTSGKEVDAAITYDDFRPLDAAAPEEARLKAAKVGTDGPALLEYLRQRSVTAATKERITRLVRRLGSEDFTEREQASKELVAAGGVAVPFLRQAAQSGDVEVAQRAQQCLKQIKGETDAEVTTAVIRLIGLRRPAGAAEVLLGFLPAAADEALAREARFALAAVAVADGKPDPVLATALQDADPLRSAAARAALGQDGGKLAQEPGRRLFLPGLKLAMKVAEYREGKKSMEWQRVEVLLFNKFPDAVFAKP